MIASLAIAIQSYAFSSTRVVKTLTRRMIDDAARDSLHALLRPSIGAAMLADANVGGLPLNGEPVEILYESRPYIVTAQDIAGLIDIQRTPIAAARLLLPPEDLLDFEKLKAGYDARLPLAVQSVEATRERSSLQLTDLGTGRFLNRDTLSTHYQRLPSNARRRFFRGQQPKLVEVTIRAATKK
ncbi:hypothetical protein [Tritonibacter sp. SIMBA_163]|uniref:hypothetical protein n=1 Tax=Tritonibacter sp. SIMBA_163 TaxID=3080868 RepID=UPI00397F8495